MFLNNLEKFYDLKNAKWLNKRDSIFKEFDSRPDGNREVRDLSKNYHNQRMQQYVTNEISVTTILETENGLVQKKDIIYTKPDKNKWFSFNAPFYTPEKNLFGVAYSTYWVNVMVIWSMTIAIALILYLDWLKKLMDAIGRFRENRMYIRRERIEKEKNL